MDRRLSSESFGAPESQISAQSEPEKRRYSRFAHPVKVVSSWEVMLLTFSGEPMETRLEQLWKHSPRVVALPVRRPPISSNAVQP